MNKPNSWLQLLKLVLLSSSITIFLASLMAATFQMQDYADIAAGKSDYFISNFSTVLNVGSFILLIFVMPFAIGGMIVGYFLAGDPAKSRVESAALGYLLGFLVGLFLVIGISGLNSSSGIQGAQIGAIVGYFLSAFVSFLSVGRNSSSSRQERENIKSR